MVSIDTSKLHPGMIVKNYKELCKILGIKPKTSNSKIRQLKEIEELVNYQKNGHAFIIKEVYDKKTIKANPLKPRDKRYKNPRNIYTRHINQILLHILNNRPKKQLNNIAFKDICVLLNLSEIDNSGNYVFRDADGSILKMNSEQYALSIQKMVSIIKSALSSLVNKEYIVYSHSEKDYSFSLSSSIQIIDLTEEEFIIEKDLLHKEFILFVKENYFGKGETVHDTSN